MINAVRSSVRANPPLPFLSSPLQNHITRVRFLQVASSSPNQSENMSQSEQAPQPGKAADDTMSSLGEGYATRCDEEGFGGIYGGKQTINKHDDDDDKVHEYGGNQGSEVKEKEEKEQARNQSKVATE